MRAPENYYNFPSWLPRVGGQSLRGTGARGVG